MDQKRNMTQKIDDILEILTGTVLPALARHDESFEVIEDRQNRMEKKLDQVAEILTDSQKTADARLRTLEIKNGIYHD